MSTDMPRHIWTVVKLGLNLVSALIVLWGIYEITNSRWAVSVAGALCVPLFSLLYLIEIDIKGRLAEATGKLAEANDKLAGANVRLDRHEDGLADLASRARGLQVGLVDDYPHFIRQITSMVATATSRVYIVRVHQTAGDLPGERDYFQLTEDRLKNERISLYRRLVNVKTPDGQKQVSRMLTSLAACERFELKIWDEPQFPSNFELVVADTRAVIAFPASPGGPPDRGIAITDGQLANYLADLFDLYWADARAQLVKGAGALTPDDLEKAKGDVKAIYDRLHPPTTQSRAS